MARKDCKRNIVRIVKRMRHHRVRDRWRLLRMILSRPSVWTACNIQGLVGSQRATKSKGFHEQD
jgi:hypothetical protein